MALVLGLSSCESETYISYYLDNTSSSTITVSGSQFSQPSLYNYTIPPQKKELILHRGSFGIRTKRPDPGLYLGEDFTVINSNGDTLQKDYRSPTNWEWDLKERKWWVSHEEVMTIMDSDF